MKPKQLLGILLLVGGVAAAIYGMSIQDSLEYKFASAFGGDTSRVALLMAGGILSAIVGVLLLVLGGKKTSTEHPVAQSHVEKSQNIQPDVSQMDDLRLTEIVDNSDSYRSEVVEASRKELLLRRKCAELLPQVQEKSDEELREIAANPQLYTEELVRAARSVEQERQRQWQQEQERAQQAARLEREKHAEERRLQRIAARKKMRPYIYTALAVLAIAAAGTGYYACQQKQERLAMERRAAEERRIAQEQKAAEERAAQERRAEEQRVAEERKRIAAERQQQEVKRILADKIYRRSVGAYLVGEYHEELGGIVFHVDKTYKHGKVISISHASDGSEDRKFWEETTEWCKSLGGKWRLPTIQEWELIYKHFYEQEIKTDYPLGFEQGGSFTKSAYWSSSKWNDEDNCNWTFRFDKGCRDGCYHNYSLYVRPVSSF